MILLTQENAAILECSLDSLCIVVATISKDTETAMAEIGALYFVLLSVLVTLTIVNLY